MSTTGHERCLPNSSDRKTPKEVVKVMTEEKYEVELSFRNVCHTLLIDLPYVAERQNEQNTHIGEVSPNVYFMKQTIGNACGTVAIIHSIANNTDVLEFDEGFLKNFIDATKSLSPDEKGKRLENDETISGAHEACAQQGQTEAVILVEGQVHFDQRSVEIPERVGGDKICLTDILKIHLGLKWIHKVENLPVNEKQPLFALALIPILQDKKQADDQNQNILQNILLKLLPFWHMSLVVNALLCSDELYFPLDQSGVTIAAVTTAVNTTWSEAAPSAEEHVDLHFVSIVHKDGSLYELDGRKSCPINHGKTTPETFLQDAAEVCKEYMKRDPTAINFTVVALSHTK